MDYDGLAFKWGTLEYKALNLVNVWDAHFHIVAIILYEKY